MAGTVGTVDVITASARQLYSMVVSDDTDENIRSVLSPALGRALANASRKGFKTLHSYFALYAPSDKNQALIALSVEKQRKLVVEYVLHQAPHFLETAKGTSVPAHILSLAVAQCHSDPVPRPSAPGSADGQSCAEAEKKKCELARDILEFIINLMEISEIPLDWVDTQAKRTSKWTYVVCDNPLHLAARRGIWDVAHTLLNRGAGVNVAFRAAVPDDQWQNYPERVSVLMTTLSSNVSMVDPAGEMLPPSFGDFQAGDRDDGEHPRCALIRHLLQNGAIVTKHDVKFAVVHNLRAALRTLYSEAPRREWLGWAKMCLRIALEEPTVHPATFRVLIYIIDTESGMPGAAKACVQDSDIQSVLFDIATDPELRDAQKNTVARLKALAADANINCQHKKAKEYLFCAQVVNDLAPE